MENKKRWLIFGFITLLVVTIAIVSSVKLNEQCEDNDHDGVCNSQDTCPNSKKGEKIDENGCDPFQFCKQFYCGMSCFKADFLENEESQYPHDCTLVVIVKEGVYEPKCVPTDCRKNLVIPESGNIKVKYPFNESYFEISLSNISFGYDVGNEKYLGWCVDENHTITPGALYNAKFYSSYDPDLAVKCPYCVSDNWDMVNYILNYKRGDAGDVQAAIWYFVDGGVYPSDSDAIAMVEDALAHGEGFIPREGQFMAIIIDVGSKTQLTIIEVDP